MYTVYWYRYPHGLEDEAMTANWRDFDSLEKAINFLDGRAKLIKSINWAGGHVEDENRNWLYEIDWEGNEEDNREKFDTTDTESETATETVETAEPETETATETVETAETTTEKVWTVTQFPHVVRTFDKNGKMVYEDFFETAEKAYEEYVDITENSKRNLPYGEETTVARFADGKLMHCETIKGTCIYPNQRIFRRS